MPGLYGLRPGLGSASKAGKAAVTENVVKATVSGGQKGRLGDERTIAVLAGKVPEPQAHARRGLFELRAPQVMHFHHHAEPSSSKAPQQVALRLGEAVRPNGIGMDILKRVNNADYSSSGSAHEINSVCLAEMVHEFLEEEAEFGPCGRARCNCKSGTCGDSSSQCAVEDEDLSSSVGGEQIEILSGLIPCVSDYETTILAAVEATVRALSDEAEFANNGEKSYYRLVMTRLRAANYNAAICKSRWEHTGGIPGGTYEYIDVVSEALGAKPQRLIVDLDFKTQFEIARPSQQYKAMLQVVPSIFVGKADRLMQIVNIVCDGTKRSVKKKGMPLPPWRKAEYIKAKWFSLYRRTTNSCSSSSISSGSSHDGDTTTVIFRGPAWDQAFTTEMEANFNNRAIAGDKRRVLRDSNGLHQVKAAVATTSSKKQEVTEPEGVVRGARLMLELAGKNSRSDAIAVPAGPGGEWELPTVDSSVRTGKAARKGTSLLATILTEGGARIRDESRGPCKPVFATGGALI